MSNSVLSTPVEFLKGVGPAKASLLNKELKIFTFNDLLTYYPFRYVDKTQFHKIYSIHQLDTPYQIKGILQRKQLQGIGHKKRLTAVLRDETGAVELVWFKGAQWIKDKIVEGKEYVAYGRVTRFNNKLSISHPELEEAGMKSVAVAGHLEGVYSTTEKLSAKGLDSNGIRKVIKLMLEKIEGQTIEDNLPKYIIDMFGLMSKKEALHAIHLPPNDAVLEAAINRLKFEELFFIQLGIIKVKQNRSEKILGYPFEKVGAHFQLFFKEKLTFELTGAQKRVVKEIRKDLGRPLQMNRLLQGDVGSGKTVVALLSLLMAIDNGFQACLLAPTSILATQHFIGISEWLEGMELRVEYLAGSVKGKKRKVILEDLAEGKIDILIGTHAILEDPVIFKKLGLAITDEQHRFGVAQRAKLWKKSHPYPPHILVMTATPIPRTLAMTLYGDLDVSIIDELPPGRKQIETMHIRASSRPRITGLIKRTIAEGHQVYIVYPLIEESAKLDLIDLNNGYEALLRDFKPPEFQISVLHGRMKQKDKDFEMDRFVKGETNIMVATTVIEVGVNVPNATVMVIENTERFGLSQLHQLRGRVGRGGNQSYCVLATGQKLSKESLERVNVLVNSTDGFVIAEADLKLRGPGNLAGTQQSGVLDLKIAELAKDGHIIESARNLAIKIIEKDPNLSNPINKPLLTHLLRNKGQSNLWRLIS